MATYKHGKAIKVLVGTVEVPALVFSVTTETDSEEYFLGSGAGFEDGITGGTRATGSLELLWDQDAIPVDAIGLYDGNEVHLELFPERADASKWDFPRAYISNAVADAPTDGKIGFTCDFRSRAAFTRPS